MRESLTKTTVVWSGLACLVAGALMWCDVPQGLTQPPVPPVQKKAVPDKAALDKALPVIQEQVKDVLAQIKQGYNTAKKTVTEEQLKAEAADLLVKRAAQTKTAVDQFLLLKEAAQLGAEAGDLSLAYWAIDDMEEQFQLNTLPLRADAVKAAVKAVTAPETANELTDQALKLVTLAVDEDNYDLAIKLGGWAEDASKKAKDLPLVLSVQRERKWIVQTEKEFQVVKPFADTLKKDPTNAEANLQVGRYYCLQKGDWNRGLYHLAQGSDKALRVLAQRDLIKPDVPKDQIAMGDAWWDAAEKQEGQIKVHVKQRAAHWYSQAVYAAGSLQAKLEERIASVPSLGQLVIPWDYSGQPKEILKFGQQFGVVFSAAFSPDGKLVASGGDLPAYIWEAQTGKKVHALQGHKSTIWSVAFDPKGKYVYTSSSDGTAKKFEVSTGKDVATFTVPNAFGQSYGMAVSANGKQLLTAGQQDLHLWDTKTAKQIHVLKGHKSPVYGLAFFPDGKKAVSMGSWDHDLIIWDLVKGTQILKINNPGNSGRSVALSPDGTKVVATGEFGRARMWDTRTGKEIRIFDKNHTSIVYAAAFSPNGKRLVTTGADGKIVYWDVSTGKKLWDFVANSPIYSISFSPGGGRVVSGGEDNGNGATNRIWGLPR